MQWRSSYKDTSLHWLIIFIFYQPRTKTYDHLLYMRSKISRKVVPWKKILPIIEEKITAVMEIQKQSYFCMEIYMRSKDFCLSSWICLYKFARNKSTLISKAEPQSAASFMTNWTKLKAHSLYPYWQIRVVAAPAL